MTNDPIDKHLLHSFMLWGGIHGDLWGPYTLELRFLYKTQTENSINVSPTIFEPGIKIIVIHPNSN